MIAFPGCTLALLAGGRGERLGGVVKAHLRLPDGRSIARRTMEELGPLFDRMLVAGGAAGDFPGLEVIPDGFTGRGPAAGLEAALGAATTRWVMTLAADVPYASESLLSLLWTAGDGFEAVVPDIGGTWQMQLALWSREPALASARRALGGGASPGLRSIAASLRVHALPEASLRALDPSLQGLRTCNDPSDLGELRLRLP